MKPDTRTVIDLFERDVRFVIPLYQRPYVWDEEHQWALLWEDIRVLLDHLVAHDGVAAYSHFLGAIVVEQETPVPGEIPLFTVIDGQQRLTTLQIIIAAAAAVARNNGSDDAAGLLRDLLLNDQRKASGDRLFKVWPTNANRTAFARVVYPEGAPPGSEDDPENRIDEAYAYFYGEIGEWVGDGTSGDVVERLRTLRVCLSDLLKLVSITLEPGDNAQVIFETLNARSTPLLALDLVKNALFREASRQGLDVDGLYEREWRPQLEDEYWRLERRQGRLNRAQAELFLMHWLSMKRRRVVPASELFVTFRNDFLTPPNVPPMGHLIAELVADAATYRGFDAQLEGTVEGDFFERMQALDISTVLPLVLLLFKEPQVSKEVRRSALRTLESWLVRRTLLRRTAKDYNNQFATLMKAVAEDPARADEAIEEHLVAADAETNSWPTDDEVVEYFSSHAAYGNVSQPRLVMLFRALERSRYSDKVESLRVPTRLSIEHVMPQKWRQNWPLNGESELTNEDAQAQRDARIHRLGNLTVTTLPLNQAMSNANWMTKQGELNRASKLLLNAEIVEKYGARFDESAIDGRTRRLARRICRIWPRTASATGAPSLTEDPPDRADSAVGELVRGKSDAADPRHLPEDVDALIERRCSTKIAHVVRTFAGRAINRPGVHLRLQKSKNAPSYFQVRSLRKQNVVAYVNPGVRDARIDYRLPSSNPLYGRATLRHEQSEDYAVRLLIADAEDVAVALQLLDDALEAPEAAE